MKRLERTRTPALLLALALALTAGARAQGKPYQVRVDEGFQSALSVGQVAVITLLRGSFDFPHIGRVDDKEGFLYIHPASGEVVRWGLLVGRARRALDNAPTA